MRASAWYDLCVTVWFATPWTFSVVLALTAQVSRLIGFDDPFPLFLPAHTLFANLLGSVVVIWALVRIRSPEPRLGRYDALARFLFATWQIFAVAQGAPRIILIFLVFEVAFGIAQALPIRRARMMACSRACSVAKV